MHSETVDGFSEKIKKVVTFAIYCLQILFKIFET